MIWVLSCFASYRCNIFGGVGARLPLKVPGATSSSPLSGVWGGPDQPPSYSSFSHHYQASIDFNTVNTQLAHRDEYPDTSRKMDKTSQDLQVLSCVTLFWRVTMNDWTVGLNWQNFHEFSQGITTSRSFYNCSLRCFLNAFLSAPAGALAAIARSGHSDQMS